MSIPMLTDANIRRAWPRDHTLHPGDCSSCGSHEFRRWQGVSVCAYCRSTAQATAALRRHAPVLDSYAANLAEAKIKMLDEYQRLAIKDIRQQYARITTD